MTPLQNPANAVPLSESAWEVVLWVSLALAVAWVLFVGLFTRHRERDRPGTVQEAHHRGVENRAARRTTSVVVVLVTLVVLVALVVFVLGRAGYLFA